MRPSPVAGRVLVFIAVLSLLLLPLAAGRVLLEDAAGAQKWPGDIDGRDEKVGLLPPARPPDLVERPTVRVMG
jgi:hypothetical protein